MREWLLLLYMKKVFVIRAEKEENREKKQLDLIGWSH
jgi:hypothetical protein